MAESDDVLRWIRELANLDSHIREEAGQGLYLVGRNQFLPLLDQWKADPEFRDLLLSACERESGRTGADEPRIIVGVAVSPENFESIRTANDSPRLADVPPDQDAKEFELHFENGAELDILTTREPARAGAIARFLQKFGEGIQQVEIYVRDVTRGTQILGNKFSLPPIYPATRAGADGTRVNFFLATGPHGKKILVELVEE